jgi:hypothetical protein
MTLTEADAKLTEAMRAALHDHAEFRASKGDTAAEVKASVNAYAAVLLEWYKEAMSRLASEPSAPANDNTPAETAFAAVRFTKEQIQQVTQNALFAFLRHFERKPSKEEQAALVSCLTRYFIAPGAPSNRLQ